MRARTLVLITTVLLAGCGEKQAEAPSSSDMTTGSPPADQQTSQGFGKVAAFSYALSFDLPSRAIESVQQSQEDACRELGPDRCIVIGATLEGRDGQYGRGSLTVLAARDLALGLTRRFTEITRKAEALL